MRRILICAVLMASCLPAYAQSAVSTRNDSLDPARAAAAGLRKLEGRHITIWTDLASDAEVDALAAAFDRAVPQWAAYFGVPADKIADWHVTCYLIGDRRPFDALELMPADYDQFAHGIAFGNKLWLHEQPTPYYRRHLLLHEGTHAFMARFLGGCGPGWYMEGTAELFSTHRFDPKTGELQLRIMPRDRREVPMLGRVKLVRDAVAEDRPLALPAVMELDNRRQLNNEAYAWSWALAKWLDSHPRYRERFRKLHEHVEEPDFNALVRREFADDWADMLAEWQAYVASLDHGYDFERMAIEFEPGKSLSRERRAVTIAADRGWQSSGVWVEAGRRYVVTAKGRYDVSREEANGRERVWPSEPGGVTIEYVDGFPLGILLGAIDARTTAGQPASNHQAGDRARAADFGELSRGEATLAGFAHPFAIGLRQAFTPSESGTLYLRVNDSGGRLGDNRGSLSATIEEAGAADESN